MAPVGAGRNRSRAAVLDTRVRGQPEVSAKDEELLPSTSRARQVHVLMEPARRSQRFGATGSETPCRHPRAEPERHAQRHGRSARRELRQLPPLPFAMVGADLAWFTQAELAPHRQDASGCSQRQPANVTGRNAAIAASGATFASDEPDLPGARIDDGNLAKGDSVYVSALFVMFCILLR